MEELNAFAICPLDGRYNDIKELLAPYFSEYSYMKYRVFVEIKWLWHLITKKIIKEEYDLDKIMAITKRAIPPNSILSITLATIPVKIVPIFVFLNT